MVMTVAEIKILFSLVVAFSCASRVGATEQLFFDCMVTYCKSRNTVWRILSPSIEKLVLFGILHLLVCININPVLSVSKNTRIHEAHWSALRMQSVF